MGSLFQLFTRFGNFFFLVFLECICILLIARGGDRQWDILMNSLGIVSNAVNKRVAKVEAYAHLDKENERLVQANQRLLQGLPGSYYDTKVVNDTLRISDTLYTYIAAEVISRSAYGAHNTLILNRGGVHGVEKGMGVIAGDGLIGIVADTAHYYSKVISILNDKSRISASVIAKDATKRKDGNTFGVLAWRDISSLKVSLENIPKYHSVEVGDTIRTSGYSFSFPQGIFIGTVSNISGKSENEGMHNIEVTLSNDPIRTQHVFVVKMKKEQKEDSLKLEKWQGNEQ